MSTTTSRTVPTRAPETRATSLRSIVVAFSSAVLAGSLLVAAPPALAAENDSAADVISSSAAARKPIRDRNISDKGTEFIKSFEGLRQDYYNDPGGYCTVGYGHLVHGKSPCTSAELGKKISRKRARALLRADIQEAESILDVQTGRTPVTQSEFDALTDFVFSIGPSWFAVSAVLEDLQARPVRYGSVPSHFKSFTKSGGVVQPGLVRRRNAEGNVFRSGNYSPYPQVS